MNLRLENLESMDLSDNKIGDEAMMFLYEATENREHLTRINVEDNPAREFILECVANKKLNHTAKEFFDTLRP